MGKKVMSKGFLRSQGLLVDWKREGLIGNLL